MRIEPIRTKRDLDLVITMIDQLWRAEEGTEEYERFHLLSTLVEEYQRSQCPLDLPDPIKPSRVSCVSGEKTKKRS